MIAEPRTIEVTFSILERIVGVETDRRQISRHTLPSLSVSSNGSLGLKRAHQCTTRTGYATFSILERIVGVETVRPRLNWLAGGCLSVSSNGSLGLKPLAPLIELSVYVSFSILERIVGVETFFRRCKNGDAKNFQYPRTDRWG